MQFIQSEKIDDITIVKLNRPQKHNAFHLPFLKEISAIFDQLAQDAQTRLIILTGSGDKAFSTGVDLTAICSFPSIEAARAFAIVLEEANTSVLRFPKPVIAAINGFAFGGGFGLASNADVRIAASHSKIGFPAVRLGAILPVGCTLRLNALIGSGRSRELLLTGRVLSAHQALEMGLVNFVVESAQLMEQSLQVAREILKGSDLALQMTKQVTNQELLSQIQQYSLSAAENFAYLASTTEWQQRIADFIAQKL